MKKRLLPILTILNLVSGCIQSLPEPYEIRYFKNDITNRNCSKIRLGTCYMRYSFGIEQLFDEELVDQTGGIYPVIKENLNRPLQVVAKDSNSTYLVAKRNRPDWESIYFYQIPIHILEQCTVSEEEYKKVKKEKALAAKIAAKKAAEKKAKIESEKKREAEQKASEKNNNVMKNYGKPFCEPFKAESINLPLGVEKIDWGETKGNIGAEGYEDGFVNGYYVSGAKYVEKKRDCLFRATFHVDQVTPDGVLVYDRQEICEGYYRRYCHDENKGPYFVVPNEKDTDLVDGDSISGLFEYVGPYTYQSVLGAPKTVLKFKHME